MTFIVISLPSVVGGRRLVLLSHHGGPHGVGLVVLAAVLLLHVLLAPAVHEDQAQEQQERKTRHHEGNHLRNRQSWRLLDVRRTNWKRNKNLVRTFEQQFRKPIINRFITSRTAGIVRKIESIENKWRETMKRQIRPYIKLNIHARRGTYIGMYVSIINGAISTPTFWSASKTKCRTKLSR